MTGEPLRVQLLGAFGAWQGTREVFLRPDPRAVLAALVLAGRPGLDAPALAELLWADDRPVAPVAGLRGHVDTLVAQLAGRHDPPPVERTAAGWRLAVPVVTDADEVRGRVVRARELLARGDACAARDEVAGDVAATARRPLDDLRAPWFSGHRRRLELLLADVLTTYADACVADGAADEAVRVLDRATRVDAFAGNPAVWDALLRAHLGDGRPDLAHDVLGAAAPVLGRDPARLAVLRGLVDEAGATEFARRIAGQTAQRVREVAEQRPVPPRPAVPVVRPAPSPAAPDVAPAFRLFGPDRLLRAGAAVRAGGYSDAVIAVLLARRATAVGLDELAGAVWGGDLPLKPQVAVEVNLTALRDACRPAAIAVAALDGPAWRLDPPPGTVDVDAAEAVAAAGREALAAGRAEEAATMLRRALGLVRGRPLDGLDGDWFAAERERLDRWWTGLVWSCVVAEVTCNRTEQALPDLRALAAANPLREDVWEWLVLAAARHEGRAAGLAVYDEAARHLRRALGATPGPGLEGVRRRIEAGQA